MINVTKTYLPPLAEYTKLLEQVWESAWLTNRGTLVQQLEAKLREYLGVDNVLLVNNGTIAIQIAIKALGLSGEVITTPFSYVATTSSLVWENCQPVFVDIETDTFSIDATQIEAAITPKTTAILATHVYGNPCDVDLIEEIANKHNLKVIYDAAHCFAVDYKGKSLYSYGDISTTSFHATKLFHTGEGGAIFCNDSSDEKALAQKNFYMHNFGHNGTEDFWGVGINGKVSELHAAMGLAVLPYLGEIIQNRKNIWELYANQLADTPLQILKIRANTKFNYAYFPVVFESESQLLRLVAILKNKKIAARRYFYPSLNNLPYVDTVAMPISDSIAKRVVCLPLYPDLPLADAQYIIDLIKSAL